MKKLIITTTDSLHGWEIESYIKPVFASVVIGTNFFAEFRASWTDAWGGRSTAYERRLQLIKDNAIEMLSEKAGRLGANCILGLKVDMDEVTGKGVQMFMITAVGMAVKVKNTTNAASSGYHKEVDKEFVKEQSNILRLFKKYDKIETAIRVDEIKEMINTQSGVFKDFLLSKLKLYSGSYNAESEQVKLIKEYFSVINPDEAIPVLYEALISGGNDAFIVYLISIIKENDLLDYNYLTKLFQGTFDQKKIGLEVALAFRPSYNFTDITAIEQLINLIEGSFQKISTITTKKGFLSSAEKEVWVCTCNNNNALDVKYCSNCSKNEYGFRNEELRPELVIEGLTNRLTGLRSLLS